MAITGVLSQVSVSDTQVSVSSAAPTGGTGPYTQQLYMSTVSGFTPGGGNIVAGATSLDDVVPGLIPNTQYYLKMVYTDSLSASGESNELGVVTSPQSLSQNQFAQSALVGMIDMRYPYNTVSVLIDASQATPLYPGAAVKMVDSAGGVPKVVGCSANSDEVLGFINFDIKTRQFLAGVPAEISMAGNVVHLFATGAVARGAQVQLDISTMGGVAQAVGSSGADIVGWALDKAAAGGVLIRVFVKTPSFLKA